MNRIVAVFALAVALLAGGPAVAGTPSTGTVTVKWYTCHSYRQVSASPKIGHSKFIPHVCPPAYSFEPPTVL